MFDDSGQELALAIVTISNLTSHPFEVPNEPVPIEAKLSNHWVRVENRYDLRGCLLAKQHREFPLLISEQAQALRFDVKYQPELIRWRLFRQALPPDWLYARYPKFRHWFWDNSLMRPLGVQLQYQKATFPSPPHWKELEVIVPQLPRMER